MKAQPWWKGPSTSKCSQLAPHLFNQQPLTSLREPGPGAFPSSSCLVAQHFLPLIAETQRNRRPSRLSAQGRRKLVPVHRAQRCSGRAHARCFALLCCKLHGPACGPQAAAALGKSTRKLAAAFPSPSQSAPVSLRAWAQRSRTQHSLRGSFRDACTQSPGSYPP